MDNDFFASRGIECDRVQPYVLEKAKRIVEALENGVSVYDLKGKRLLYDRHVISFHLDRSHRVIATDKHGKVKVTRVVTHEHYNKLLDRR